MTKLLGLTLIVLGFFPFMIKPVIGLPMVIAGLLLTWNYEQKARWWTGTRTGNVNAKSVIRGM